MNIANHGKRIHIQTLHTFPNFFVFYMCPITFPHG